MKFTTLALAAAATLALASPSHAVSLLTNGSFEDNVVGGPPIIGFYGQDLATLGLAGSTRNWDVYSELPGGWRTTTTDPAGFEVQTNPTLGGVDAQDGFRYIELESDPANPSISNIYQDFTVALSGYYELSFWYQPRVNTAGENQIHALFGGIDTIVSGPPVPAFGTWTQIVVQAFFASSLSPYRLEFNALGTIDNTLGGFIDNVAINSVRLQSTPDVPLPAGLLLLLSGLAGLGFLGRFRAKAAS